MNAPACTLLNRIGPSLFQPGALEGPVTFDSFSTNTFLDGFVPSPETGSLYAPFPGVRLSSPDEALSMAVRLLSEGNSEAFRITAGQMMNDAGLIADLQNRWGGLSPYPLPETEGRWRLTQDQSRVQWNGPGGRSIALSENPDERLQLTYGQSGRKSRVAQTVVIAASGQVRTGSYEIEFLNGGFRHLKHYLGMTDRSPAEVALEVALRIYAPGQYTEAELNGSPRVSVEGGAWKALTRRGSDWRVPRSVDLESADLFSFGSTRRLPNPDGERKAVAMFEVFWEGNSDDGHLKVRLQHPGLAESASLMPLKPELRELLWDGARVLIYS